jgi:hypothetical protein
MNLKYILILAILLLVLLTGAAASLDLPAVDWWVIAGGGGSTSNGGNVTLNATLGQPIASTCLNSGDVRLQSGYWSTGWTTCGGAIYLPLVSR